MENGICPKCQTANDVEQIIPPDSTSASVYDTVTASPTPTIAVATATKPDFKSKIIAVVIVIAILGGLYWGISHFLFGDLKEKQKPTFAMNMTAAEIALSDYVTNPSTLQFSYADEDWEFVTNDNKRIKIESSFDCQNAFGVTETHDFVLIITYSDDYEDFTINELYIDKQEYV